ncbi:MAG: nucleoside monophosphate kinase [Candidatus Pacebacteria bacterium]|nr:nucleoside monophosphate kinase [Candidatus Paceibacterota bacterium]MDD2756985.1 nucleoside monophosphate kinase [Candidatus Paceibacterota bacterium]MDD3283495.1 nucleoside monophosphate kinase [Candidatus Paceibacterota bacterium]MDD3969649.1 nucleoside monophosphate kinase [Candidatus Paceibacterota bacterium]MDD4737879.1 nucleoside monophosphate kinase [Candidatus Paceibacterota bacterium]
MDFPIEKTKMGDDRKFNLSDPKEREEYFKLKCGVEIEKLKEHLNSGHTFIAYLLGKKNSGKGTYSKMFSEVIGAEKIEHLSVGDMVRAIDEEMQDPQKKADLVEFLEKNYRGFYALEDIIKSLEDRDTKSLLPDEIILVLVKREITKRKGKVILLDGFPRNLDQVSFSLFFRDLVDYRDDPDVFVLIDVPMNIINERIKWRRICPKCNASRSLRLLPTSKIGQDEGGYYLICDEANCDGGKMVMKEGDEKGIEPIKDRLLMDEEILRKAYSLYGVPKVLLRNAIPADVARDYVDDYEMTPGYSFETVDGEIKIIEEPWIVADDEGVQCVSLQAAPVVVSMIKQLVEVFKI